MGQNSAEATEYAGHNTLTGSPRRLRRRGEFPSHQNLTNLMIGKAFLAKPRAFGVKGVWCRRSRLLRRIHFGLRLNPVSQLESASNLVQSEEWPDCRCLGKARGKFSPMSDAEKTETTRELDTTAVLLLSALGVLAALVGATLIYLFHPVGTWGLAVCVLRPFGGARRAYRNLSRRKDSY
jgi:hypothetical protein